MPVEGAELPRNADFPALCASGRGPVLLPRLGQPRQRFELCRERADYGEWPVSDVASAGRICLDIIQLVGVARVVCFRLAARSPFSGRRSRTWSGCPRRASARTRTTWRPSSATCRARRACTASASASSTWSARRAARSSWRRPSSTSAPPSPTWSRESPTHPEPTVAHPLPPRYVAFDFHKECRNLDWSNLQKFIDRVQPTIQDYGWEFFPADTTRVHTAVR